MTDVHTTERGGLDSTCVRTRGQSCVRLWVHMCLHIWGRDEGEARARRKRREVTDCSELSDIEKKHKKTD